MGRWRADVVSLLLKKLEWLKETIMIYIRLKELAEKQGLTIGDLSHISHVRPTLLLAIYKNPTKSDITLKTLDHLAKALHVPAKKLIESRDDPPETKHL